MGRVIFIAALAHDSTKSVRNSVGCVKCMPGAVTPRMVAAAMMTPDTYIRAAGVSCFTRVHQSS